MATNREKVIYNITLQSEEDDDVKVIDRFNVIRVKPFLIVNIYSLPVPAPAWRRCLESGKSAADCRRVAVRAGRKVLR